MTVLQQMRKKTDMPVIMLTARVDQKDRVDGLNAGADDYVPKPFDADELLARIRAVLRRTERVRERADDCYFRWRSSAEFSHPRGSLGRPAG